MRVVIDARMYGPRKFTGIGRYIEELIAHLEKLDNENQYIVLLGRTNFTDYTPAAANFHKILSPYPHYSLSEQLLMPWQLYRLHADLVHFPNFNAPLLYWRRRVTTIQDLTTILYASRARPGLVGSLKQLKRLPARLLLWWTSKTSTVIITSTKYVKTQLEERYRLPSSRITVTSLGVTSRPVIEAAEPKLKPSGPFLFYVGTYYPHKNIDRLIEAFAIISRQLPDLRLVLAGKDDYTYEAVRGQVQRMNLKEKVLLPGTISDEELSWYYGHATAYVFPSLSEGFGLPGLEAMAYGTPVLAARASCLPEVYGSAAAYFEPYNSQMMAQQIIVILEDEQELSRLGAAGRTQVKGYSWETLAKLTLGVYRSLG